jgi:hypothetical protein
MAVAVDTSSHATAKVDTGNNGITWSHTAGASATKLCVLWGCGISAASVPNFTATYNAVSMTNQIQRFDGSFCGMQGFYLDLSSPDGAAHNIVVKNSGDVGSYQMAAIGISFTGAATGAPATGSNTATSANATVTVAGSANGDIVIAGLMSDLGPTGTTTEGQTLIFEDENINSDTDFNAERTTASGANTVMSWTHSSINWAAVGMSIAGTGGTTTRGMPFGPRSTAFNGGRTFKGPIFRAFALALSGLLVPSHKISLPSNDVLWRKAA